MNKRYIILFVLLFIAILITGLFLINKLKQSKDSSQAMSMEEYTPEEEISEEQSNTNQTVVTLYFPNKETKKVMPEAQSIDVKEMVNNPYQKLMELLIKGPSSEKLEKVIPENTLILGNKLENSCLTLNLSQELLNYDKEDENSKENLIECIVNTMTELTEVNQVKIIIEGHENEEFSNIYERSVTQL